MFVPIFLAFTVLKICIKVCSKRINDSFTSFMQVSLPASIVQEKKENENLEKDPKHIPIGKMRKPRFHAVPESSIEFQKSDENKDFLPVASISPNIAEEI